MHNYISEIVCAAIYTAIRLYRYSVSQTVFVRIYGAKILAYSVYIFRYTVRKGAHRNVYFAIYTSIILNGNESK